MAESKTNRKSHSFHTAVASEATIALMQVLLTELSTIAFVSSIMATICFPNLLAPAQQWTELDWWVTDGSDPNAPVTDAGAFMRQYVYGFLWCFSSTNALASVLASLGLALSVMFRARTGDELSRLVAFYKRMPTSVYMTRFWPKPIRVVAEPLADVTLWVVSCFTRYRPSLWDTPYVHLIGATAYLFLAMTYNIYWLVPDYVWSHAASTTIAVPFVYLWVKMGQTGGADVDEEEAREEEEARRQLQGAAAPVDAGSSAGTGCTSTITSSQQGDGGKESDESRDANAGVTSATEAAER